MKSRVFENTGEKQSSLHYIERLGKPRIVAGAVMQPRFIEGVDENGTIRSRIQVRSVVTHPIPHISSTRQVAEEVSEPVYRKGGLFDKEDDSFIGISDEQVVREGLYDENGEISHELLEERLDREIRQSLNSLS